MKPGSLLADFAWVATWFVGVGLGYAILDYLSHARGIS